MSYDKSIWALRHLTKSTCIGASASSPDAILLACQREQPSRSEVVSVEQEEKPMKVREAMTTKIVTVDPGAQIRRVAQLMSEVDTGIIPIIDGDAIGVVTDRDIVIRAVAEGISCDQPVSSIMTSGIEGCLEEDDLLEAAARMSELQMRRLVVFDAAGAVSGILSLGDIAVRQEEIAGVALEEISDDTQRRD